MFQPYSNWFGCKSIKRAELWFQRLLTLDTSLRKLENMKSIILTLALIAALCGLCQCQKKNVYVPSDSEIEELLNDPKKVKEVVDCVIRFTPGKCDPKLKDAYDLAPEYFATGGSCRSCSDDILRKVRRFLQRLQKKYRKEYQRLINNVT